jgi:8-oxo-dGTP diphosphatase
MVQERFVFIPEIALFLIREGKILLLRRANTGYEDGKYCFPAGHKEALEPATLAVIREAKEEAGIDVAESDIEFVHYTQRNCGDHERAAFFFRAKEWQGEPSNIEPQKCDDMQWFPLDQLPEMIPYMRAALEHHLAGRMYSEKLPGRETVIVPF